MIASTRGSASNGAERVRVARCHRVRREAAERVAGDRDLLRIDGRGEPGGFGMSRIGHRVDHRRDVLRPVQGDRVEFVLGVAQPLDRRVPGVVGRGDDVPVAGDRLGVVRVEVAQPAAAVGVDHERERSAGGDHGRVGIDGGRRFVVDAGEQGVLVGRQAGRFVDREPHVHRQRAIAGGVGDRDRLHADVVRARLDRLERRERHGRRRVGGRRVGGRRVGGRRIGGRRVGRRRVGVRDRGRGGRRRRRSR